MGKRGLGARAVPSRPGLRGREGGRVTRVSGASARAKPKAFKLGSAAGGSGYRPKGADFTISRGSSPAFIPEPEKTAPSAKTQGPRL